MTRVDLGTRDSDAWRECKLSFAPPPAGIAMGVALVP